MPISPVKIMFKSIFLVKTVFEPIFLVNRVFVSIFPVKRGSELKNFLVTYLSPKDGTGTNLVP